LGNSLAKWSPELPDFRIESNADKYTALKNNFCTKPCTMPRYNCVYLFKSNSCNTSTKAVNYSCVNYPFIHIEGFIVPFFFNEYVSGDTYLKMLHKYFHPRFRNYSMKKTWNSWTMKPLQIVNCPLEMVKGEFSKAIGDRMCIRSLSSPFDWYIYNLLMINLDITKGSFCRCSQIVLCTAAPLWDL